MHEGRPFSGVWLTILLTLFSFQTLSMAYPHWNVVQAAVIGRMGELPQTLSLPGSAG